MKKTFIGLLVLVLFTGFISCNDDDEASIYSQDVYYLSKFDDSGEVVYGIGLYGTTNQALSSVSVSAPDDTYSLDSSSDTYFYFESEDEDYSTSKPSSGSYTFTYTFKSGEVLTQTSTLGSSALDPVVLTSCSYDTDDNQVNVEWEATDADYIIVYLRKTDGTYIFQPTSYLDGDETDYSFSASTSTWDSTPVTGTTYVVEVRGISVNTSDYQAFAIATANIIWGEETTLEE